MERRLPLIFLALAVLGGLLGIALNPPLRGPDEPAHFLRALGIAHGDLVPRTTDAQGRRGLYVAQDVYEGFALFNAIRQAPPARSIYVDAFGRYFARPSLERDRAGPVFVPYEGSESYSPIPYLAYVPAVLISEALGLKFLGTLYAMRIAGLLAAAALAAYAIAVAPHLQGMFFCTAMLPTAIYQRAVLRAEGAALSTALLVMALCLRAIQQTGGAWQRTGWIAASALCKPPQIAFALLELMHSPATSRDKWIRPVLVMSPAFVLSLCWILLSSADVGAWRVRDDSALPAYEFDPMWKLVYLLRHPFAFARMSVTSLDYTPELWRQLIGLFGWLDVPMRPWIYAATSLLLALCSFERLALSPTVRMRAAAIALLAAIVYCLAVFVIFFVTLTPSTADRIHGLQGRYFIVVLPLLAVVVSAMVNRGTDHLAVFAAYGSAALSIGAMTDALWGAHWSG
jgi:uncharacterized membrane protein